MQKENDRLDKLSRRVVSERDKLVIERDNLVAERDGLAAEKNSSLSSASKQVRELEAIRDKLTQEKNNVSERCFNVLLFTFYILFSVLFFVDFNLQQ